MPIFNGVPGNIPQKYLQTAADSPSGPGIPMVVLASTSGSAYDAGGGGASTTSNTPTSGSAAGDVLTANTDRKAWMIQNNGTNPLFVRLGTGASSSVFHVVLKAGSANDDGTGGFFSDNAWRGIVSVAGTSPRYVYTQLT